MPHSGFGRTSTPLQRKLGRVWLIGRRPPLEEFYLGILGVKSGSTLHLPLVVSSFFFLHLFSNGDAEKWLPSMKPCYPVWQASKTSTHFKLFDRRVFLVDVEYFYLFWSNTLQESTRYIMYGYVWLTLAASIQPWNGNIYSFHRFFMTIWPPIRVCFWQLRMMSEHDTVGHPRFKSDCFTKVFNGWINIQIRSRRLQIDRIYTAYVRNLDEHYYDLLCMSVCIRFAWQMCCLAPAPLETWIPHCLSIKKMKSYG